MHCLGREAIKSKMPPGTLKLDFNFERLGDRNISVTFLGKFMIK